jgi:hypothetical protein
MSESHSPEIAELRSEVAALSAVVAALFGTTTDMNYMGDVRRLLDFAAKIGTGGTTDPQAVRRVAERIAVQAASAAGAANGA